MILINGESKTQLSVLDRGLQYGDGLFETLAIQCGEVRRWSRHWQRLLKGCQALYLPPPDEQVLLDEIASLTAKKNRTVVKVLYTRGSSGRGYAFNNVEANRIIMALDWPDYPPENQINGIELFFCQTRLARQPLLAGLKHLNRLENVLARHEWSDKQYAEGLLCDTHEHVVEGTMSNVFLVHNGSLLTPSLTHCGVEGVTRQCIIDLADQQNIPVAVKQLNMNDVYAADEMFVCNSLIGIWPVKKILGKRFTRIGVVDSITTRLQQSINHSI